MLRDEGPIRVVTFNIHHGEGLDGRHNLERIATLVESADVVALQEVDRFWGARSEFSDQLGWLAERMQMEAVFGANLDREPAGPGAPRRQYGTAILSRLRIDDWVHTLLESAADDEQRGLLMAYIDVGDDGVLTVANVHLESWSPALRLTQAAQIREVLAAVAPSEVVLLGDFNATPDAPEIAAMGVGLVDAWAVGGDGDGATFPAPAPGRRIDYVLVSPGLAIRHASVLSTDASDHFAVTVDLTVGAS